MLMPSDAKSRSLNKTSAGNTPLSALINRWLISSLLAISTPLRTIPSICCLFVIFFNLNPFPAIIALVALLRLLLITGA